MEVLEFIGCTVFTSARSERRTKHTQPFPNEQFNMKLVRTVFDCPESL